MAGWADLYAPQSAVPLGFTLGDIAKKRANTSIDAATDEFDRGKGYGRALEDTVSSFSSRGAGYSSAKNKATNRMFEDYTEDTAKGRLGLSRALDDLDQQRRLATFGVIY